MIVCYLGKKLWLPSRPTLMLYTCLTLVAQVNTESLESAAEKYKDFREPPAAALVGERAVPWGRYSGAVHIDGALFPATVPPPPPPPGT